MTVPPAMPKIMKDHMPKRNKSMSAMRGKMTMASNMVRVNRKNVKHFN